jgi:hypothetical protein
MYVIDTLNSRDKSSPYVLFQYKTFFNKKIDFYILVLVIVEGTSC